MLMHGSNNTILMESKSRLLPLSPIQVTSYQPIDSQMSVLGLLARTGKAEVLRIRQFITLDDVSKDPCPWQSSFIRGIFATSVLWK